MLILSGFILAGQNIMPLYLADDGEAMDKMAVFLNGDRACFKIGRGVIFLNILRIFILFIGHKNTSFCVSVPIYPDIL